MSNEVDAVWKLIDEQRNRGLTSNRIQHDKTPNSIRVFVSSTFTDFFNEREILVKQVTLICFEF